MVRLAEGTHDLNEVVGQLRWWTHRRLRCRLGWHRLSATGYCWQCPYRKVRG